MMVTGSPRWVPSRPEAIAAPSPHSSASCRRCDVLRVSVPASTTGWALAGTWWPGRTAAATASNAARAVGVKNPDSRLIPSTPCGPRIRPRRFARSRSSKEPSGFSVSASLRPTVATNTASWVWAWVTNMCSARSRSVGDTVRGSRSKPLQTSRMWSSPTVPASTAAASTGRSGGRGGPVSDRRSVIRAAIVIRRRTSAVVIRSRDRSTSTTCTPGGRPASSGPSGGSASCPNSRYDNPRVRRSWVSNRPATSMRNALPTRSVDNPRNRAWAASMTSRSAHTRSRITAGGRPDIPPRYSNTCSTQPGRHRMWMKPQLWTTTPDRRDHTARWPPAVRVPRS